MLELKTVLEEFKTLPADLDMGLGTEEISLGNGSLSECCSWPLERTGTVIEHGINVMLILIENLFHP